MKCSNCSILNSKLILKNCLRCNSESLMQNICVICDVCSNSGMQCSCCLKKMRQVGSKPKSGCRSCGK